MKKLKEDRIKSTVIIDQALNYIYNNVSKDDTFTGDLKDLILILSQKTLIGELVSDLTTIDKVDAYTKILISNNFESIKSLNLRELGILLYSLKNEAIKASRIKMQCTKLKEFYQNNPVTDGVHHVSINHQLIELMDSFLIILNDKGDK